MLKNFQLNDFKKSLGNIRFFSEDTLYCIALVLCLFYYAVNDSTMYSLPKQVVTFCTVGMRLLLFLHILFYVRFTRTELVFSIILFAAAFMVQKVTPSYTDPVMWSSFVIGAKGVSFKKILKIYITVVGSVVLLAFAGAWIGVIENLQYETTTRGIRGAFGIIYPTNCAALIFYLMTSFFYVNKDNLKNSYFAAGLIITIFFWYACNGRVDALSCLLMLAGFFYLKKRTPEKYMAKLQYKTNPVLRNSAILAFPVLVIVTLIFTLAYDSSVEWMMELNTLVSNRLALGLKGFTDYGTSLFGQKITMVGAGGSTADHADYFYLDSSYVNILLRYGTIFAILAISVFAGCCRKYREDKYFLVCIIVIAINSVIAHHLIELEYNLFGLALFAAAESNPAGNRCKIPVIRSSSRSMVIQD